MLPVTAGAKRTKIEMLIYTLDFVPLSLTPAFDRHAGPVYLTGAAVLGALFIFCAVRVCSTRLINRRGRCFGYSIIYLTLLFSLLLVERAIRAMS